MVFSETLLTVASSEEYLVKIAEMGEIAIYILVLWNVKSSTRSGHSSSCFSSKYVRRYLKLMISERFYSSMDQPLRTKKVDAVLKKRLNWI